MFGIVLLLLVLQSSEAENVNKAVQTAYALDLNAPTSQTSFTCIRINQYSVVFLRGYSPDGQGAFDSNVSDNIQNAYNAGLGIEVYMSPSLTSTKTGPEQFQEMYRNLEGRFDVRAIWLQVTMPVKWEPYISKNIEFISSIINAAKANGLTVGIYTNPYDWKQITNDWTGPTNTLLWYWNVLGAGPMAESSDDFGDFHPFSIWSNPSVKQFGQQENICGQTVNRDIYSITASVASKPSTGQNGRIRIGGYV